MVETVRSPTPRGPRPPVVEVPVQSTTSRTQDGPSSPTPSSADTWIDLPFLTPRCSLALESKRVAHVRNAIVVSKLATCRLATFTSAVDAYASMHGNGPLEKDAFVALVRSVPGFCVGETFKPMEETLERIYRAFERMNWTDVYHLATACLVLVAGEVKAKVETAIKYSLCGCGVDRESPITWPIVCTALSCLLQSVTAVFDLQAATQDEVPSTASIVTTCVDETVARLFAANSLGKDDEAEFQDHIWSWIDSNSSLTEAVSWIKLLDPTKWPGANTVTSSSSLPSSPSKGELREDSASVDGDDDVEYDDEGDESTELSFRFSSVEGGVLTIGEEQAAELFDLLVQSAFTRITPQAMYDTFVQHTGDGLLEEETFLEAIEELLSMTDKPHLMENNMFLESMLSLFRSFLPENCPTVDAFEIAAGFSLMSWGSKSDKLSSAFHYFDADSKGYLNRQQLWKFLRSVLVTLLHLSPPSDAIILQYGSLAELVDKGEEEIIETIMDGIPSEEGEDEDEDEDEAQDDSEDNEAKPNGSSARSVDEVGGEHARVNSDMRLGFYTFENFGLWYNGGGFQSMSWLELLDLRKWVFVSPSFALEKLDTRSVDPVVASNNYYTANNIQVDIDAVDPPDGAPGMKKTYFTFADVIDEDDDEDEAEPTRQNPHDSAASIESSSTAVRSYNSSIPATLPAICLKNEIVLEFELPFDANDDAITELPLTTLSFDNGNLIQFFELQRVIKLDHVQLYRVYDVFEPYMDEPAFTSIEKRTFDKCVGKLLPVNVAPSVAAAFGANTTARVPPRSVGRGKDPKMVADTLSRLFFAFNRSGTGKIDLIEFVSAFTILCEGSKSEKLAFAFRLFDADGDGCLTRREMWKYLRSFLTMLLALGNGSELSAEAIASVADTTAIEIADCIFKDTDKTCSVRHSLTSVQAGSERHSLDIPDFKSLSHQRGHDRYEHRGSFPGETNLHLVGAASSAAGPGAGNAFLRGGIVSFEEFAVWYSQHGYTMIAWIELLDTKKWPEVPRSVSEAILRYISRQQHALENATQMGSEEIGSGSSNDTVSSNESTSRLNQSLVPNVPESNMNTRAFRTTARNAVEAGMDAVTGIANLITSPTDSGTAKDLSSVALQFKLTSYDNTTLRIRLKDVAIVYTISERMNFSRMTCGELVHLLKKHAHNRSLTKPGYLRAMRNLVPRDELSNEDQEFLSFHLLRIFTLYESESVLQNGDMSRDSVTDDGDEQGGMSASDMNPCTISVETLQLVAGMCVFCGTTKSAKLSALFKLFASHGDGYVSRRRLFEMLKSILVVLFAFSSYRATENNSNDSRSANVWSTNSIAERAAGAVVSKLFGEVKCKRPDSINLAEFAAWYAAGGYIDCPWLELLDLSKWPAKEAFEASKREKPLIYAFDMLEEGSILHFTENDISTYLFMLRSTKLGELSVGKMYDTLLAYATPSAEEALKMSKAVGTQSHRGQMYSYAAVEEDEGAYLVLTRANFYECVRCLVSKNNMSEKAQQTSSKLLSRLFNVFDRKRCGRVNALELACGLSILGRGSKSQKLSLAFDFITKMRQQRRKTLASYAPPPSTNIGLGFGAPGVATGGFGFGVGGVPSSHFSMSDATLGFSNTREFASMAQGTMRRHPPVTVAEINALPHSVLFIYLRSFLLALMALSDGTYRLGLEKIYVEADDFIEEAMGDLMTDVTTNGGTNGVVPAGIAAYGSARSRACVTFEQFGEWYNTGGYQLISWVELLDVSKWQQQQDFQDQSITMSTAGPASVYRSKRMTPLMGSQKQIPLSTTAPMPVEPMQPIQHTTKPVTRKRQVRQSDIVSTPFVRGLPTAGTSDPKPDSCASGGAMSLSSDGPVMVFAIAKDAAELQFYNDDIATLKLFLRQTQLHSVTSWELQGAVLEALNFPAANHAGIMCTKRSMCLRAIQQACGTLTLVSDSSGSPGYVSDEGMELLQSLLGVFVHEASSDEEDERRDDEDDDEPEELVDIGAAICGLLVMCQGSLFDKLKCCAALSAGTDGARALQKREGERDERDEEESHDVMVTLKTLKSSLTCFIMAFYGLSSSLSADMARYSAELGAEAVVQSFAETCASVDEEKLSLRAFSDWFSESGYPSHPWLELVELRHWPAAINVCGSNGITDDVE
ncbi:hypothetical protein PsorP6_017064 [Peronosclerospora sorghi]|uniref:Uncharacterized protein n=1 Tax=Peronosclerospora sorghi TaxID=230839 RepID=A0ACC0WEY9_9STRA|nr:hypothetical protein PsorP6_017064 [Peronosclerospora sorghi]